MSEEVAVVAEGDGHETGKKRVSKKKLIIFILIPLLLVGSGAGLYFTGKLDSLLHKKPAEEEGKDKGDHKEGDKEGHDKKGHGEKDAKAEGPGYYHDLPDIIVNLNDTGTKQRFLKLSISLEIDSKEEEPKLEAVMPRITDHFQTYLRELRVDDLRGSAGIYRLRQELLSRVRTAADPVEIRDVLFREILVQ